jgi:hypothetical protein
MSFFEEQNFGHQIQQQINRSNEIVCEFCNNITYYDRAVNAQRILASNGVYQGRYYNIDDKIRSLNSQISETEEKKNSFFTLRQSTKERHTATLNGLRQQLASTTADRVSLSSLYDDYKNYVSTLPEFNSGHLNTDFLKQRAINTHTLNIYDFFNELKKCTITVNAGIGVPVDDNAGIGVPVDDNASASASAIATPIGGRKSKKRKSSRKSSRKSRKSRKSYKKRKHRK